MENTDSTPSTQQRKSTLFCPTCGYQSRAETGWLQYSLPDGRRHRCPQCFEAISRRPTEAWPSGLDLYADQVQSGLAAWNASLARWNESIKALQSP